MTVAYLIEFDVRSDCTDRFLELLGGVLDAMSEEENFRGCALAGDPEVPGRFLLYETWADHDDVLNVQLQRPYRQAYHDALADLLASPRKISVWEPLTTIFPGLGG